MMKLFKILIPIFVLFFSSSILANKCVSGNCINGYGIFHYEDRGMVYEGNFKEGLGGWGYPNGYGKKHYEDGRTFEGNFVMGALEGKGIYKYKNGTIYDGFFKKNKRHGKGVIKYENGNSFIGEFKNDSMYHGVYSYLNGDKYIGYYKGINRNGFGIFISSNGEKKIGQWKKNKFLNSRFKDINLISGYKDFVFGMPKNYLETLEHCDNYLIGRCYDNLNWFFQFHYSSKENLEQISINIGSYDEDYFSEIKSKLESKYSVDFVLCKSLIFQCTPKELKSFLNSKTDHFAYSFHNGQVLLTLKRLEDEELIYIEYFNEKLAEENFSKYNYTKEITTDDL